MKRHGSGHNLGWLGETAYRIFRRLPTVVNLAIPMLLFLGLMNAGEAALLAARPHIAGLAPENNYRSWAFGVIPFFAFLICVIVFELALITEFSKTGRWKLLKLQTSLSDIRSLPPREFERLVGAAYEQQGYRVDFPDDGPDGGVDLVLNRGNDKVLVQCKNWSRSWTGVAEVRELLGALTAERAPKAIFVTSGVFSEEAIEFAKGQPIQLIDGEALLDIISAVQESGSASVATADIAEESLNYDKRCPICGSPTVRKQARRGEHAGRSFWSCSRFPGCYGIAPE